MPLIGRKPETAAEPDRFFGYNARSAYPENNRSGKDETSGFRGECT
jgi:hypothetical protein